MQTLFHLWFGLLQSDQTRKQTNRHTMLPQGTILSVQCVCHITYNNAVAKYTGKMKKSMILIRSRNAFFDNATIQSISFGSFYSKKLDYIENTHTFFFCIFMDNFCLFFLPFYRIVTVCENKMWVIQFFLPHPPTPRIELNPNYLYFH